MDSSPARAVAATSSTGESGIGPRVRDMLERRTRWLEALVVLATTAVGFVVLGFLASYFQDYFHLILMFGLAALLAFLISPVADFLQRRLSHLPRAVAVIAVIVPVIVILAILAVRIVVSLAESFVQLAAALPGLAANPPRS